LADVRQRPLCQHPMSDARKLQAPRGRSGLAEKGLGLQSLRFARASRDRALKAAIPQPGFTGGLEQRAPFLMATLEPLEKRRVRCDGQRALAAIPLRPVDHQLGSQVLLHGDQLTQELARVLQPLR